MKKGNKTYELHLKAKYYNVEELISICQADTGEGVCCQAAEGLLQDYWDGCEVEHHSESCNGGFLL
jgi:hypothetical protein